MSRAQSTNISNTASGNSATDQGNAQSAYSTLMPSLTGQLAAPGYTDPQKTAITGATEGGVGAAFGSASEGAANRAARTNNAAGLGGEQDALARQRMITSGNLGAQNQTNFANNAQQQKGAAQAGIGQLFGTNLSAANNALGTAATASAAAPSFWDQFGAATAKSLGTFGGSGNVGNTSVGFG
jgi:hypothetical protein